MFIQKIVCGVFQLVIWAVIYGVIANSTDGITRGIIKYRRNNSLFDGPTIDFSVIFEYNVDGVDDYNRQAYTDASFDFYDKLYINSTHTVYYLKNNPSVAKLMPINEVSESIYYTLLIGIILQTIIMVCLIAYNAPTCKKEITSTYINTRARVL